MADEKNIVSIEYLIDVISSVKSALNNISGHNTQIYDIISEISENINVMTETLKRQNQDQKSNTLKLDETSKELGKIVAKIELSTQEITSAHDKLSSNLDIIFDFKRESLDDINKSLKKISDELDGLKIVKDRKEKRDKNNDEDSDDGEKQNFFSKIIVFIKNINESVNIFYKIMVLLFGIGLVIMLFLGIITWTDIKNIVGLKFF